MSLVLICDESGSKGYADQQEKRPGEVGVMAGYLLPAARLDTVGVDLEAICQPFRRLGKKLHLTELGPDAEVLRGRLFDYFENQGIRFLYEAIHTQGFYEANRPNPDAGNTSLHKELALGLFSKALAFMEDQQVDGFIRIIRDRIDYPIVRGFAEAFEAFLNDDPVVELHKRGHPDPELRTKAWVYSQITWPTGYDVESFGLQGYSVESDSADSALTVAADALVGDLVYFFCNRAGGKFAGPVGQVGALDGHRLARLCYGLTSPGGVIPLCDTVYRHPVHAAREEVAGLKIDPARPEVRARLTEIVRGRAYMLHKTRTGVKLPPEADWYLAREELLVPIELHL